MANKALPKSLRLLGFAYVASVALTAVCIVNFHLVGGWIIITPLVLGMLTQAMMVTAIWLRWKQVRWLSLLDVIGGVGRTIVLLALGRFLIHFSPVIFFQSDICACSDPRLSAPMIPLDNYYGQIALAAGAVIFALMVLWPIWYLNWSETARRYLRG